MPRSFSTPPPSAQTHRPIPTSQTNSRFQGTHNILRWVMEEEEKAFKGVEKQKLALELKCTKIEKEIGDALLKIENLQAKISSQSRAQREQRAEFVKEKKGIRESHGERIRELQKDFGQYKVMSERELRELRAEKNDLVNSVEALDKQVIQGNITQAKLQEQNDDFNKFQKKLVCDVAELGGTIETVQRERGRDSETWRKEMSELRLQHDREVRIWEERIQNMTVTSKPWQAKETEYLQRINHFEIDYQKLQDRNDDLMKMAEIQATIWTDTLQRHESERPEKRRRISNETQGFAAGSPSMQEQPVPRCPSFVLIHHEEQYRAPYAQQHHNHHDQQQFQLPPPPSRSSNKGRYRNRGQHRGRSRSGIR